MRIIKHTNSAIVACPISFSCEKVVIPSGGIFLPKLRVLAIYAEIMIKVKK